MNQKYVEILRKKDQKTIFSDMEEDTVERRLPDPTFRKGANILLIKSKDGDSWEFFCS